jgi:hypothetical protein
VAIVVNPNGGYDVLGTHTYADQGPVTFGVTVSDEGGATPLTASANINVLDAPLSGMGTTITPLEGDPNPPVVTVATFADTGGAEALSKYNATVDWGEGSLTTGPIVRAGQTNTFVVQGQHAYAATGVYDITVQVNHDAATPILIASTANVTDAIAGVPASSPEGSPVTLSAASDTGISNTHIGSQYLFQVHDSGGGTALVGHALTFNGSNSIPLPSGVIHDATSLTVDVTFRTTQSGVILGYQNQPAGNVPTNFVPALYVGTNGELYAEFFVGGAPSPIVSGVAVNDGQSHHAVLTLSGNTQTLKLDDHVVGSLTGSFTPLDMTFAQLGTGFTMTWPGIKSEYVGFVGTIDQVAIETSPSMTASLVSGPRSRDLWQVTNGSGGTEIVGRALTFTGASDAIALPAGLVNGASNLTVDVTFQTTAGGVILGYQNEPLGTLPGNFVPALYVGTDGHLYAEIYDATLPIRSSGVVNDGLTHHAVLTLTGGTKQTLTLDGIKVGTLSGSVQPLDMKYDQLGTGETATWRAGNGGYDPFIGVIDQVAIATSPTLSASVVSDQSFSDTQDGIRYLYQVSSPNGATALAGRALTFTGSDSIPLPSGLVHDAANLTVDVTFRTTQGGVLLGYQDQPAGTTPGNFVPALYVGTDGRLYAELFNNAFNPIRSSGVVNDGLTHHAVLTRSGSKLTLTLDGVRVGTLAGPFNMLGMTFNQLGTGYTGGPWPAGTGGADPFVGTIDQVVISTDPTLAASLAQPGQWQVNARSGQTQLTAQGLTFTGATAIPLPNGLVHDATNLTLDVTFQTTQGGVILGYQNQPVTGPTPGYWVPALYVGGDGLLYGELWDGHVNPIHSMTAVNDGKAHHAVLSLKGSTLTLTLDGVRVGQLAGTFDPREMTFNQLGTGFTAAWPGGTGGYDNFIGTLNRVVITTDSPLAPSAAVGGSVAGQLLFTPPDQGTYVLTQYSTGPDGRTATTTRTLNVTDVPIKVSAGGNTVVVQGSAFHRTGSFTDAAGDGPWTATVDYGDGAGIQPLSLAANHTFVLNHVYPNAGLFNVVVTVSNAEGDSTQGKFSVSVTGFTVNDGSAQQSMVTSLTYTFPSPTQIEPGAFVLLRNGQHTPITMMITPLSDRMTYIITFSGPGVIGGSVPDGSYTLITRHGRVNVLSGPPMTQDDVNTFDRLFGDANGDGVVNTKDLARLRIAEAHPSSPYVAVFDFNGNRVIDSHDIAEFFKRDDQQLDTLWRPPAQFPGRKAHQTSIVPHELSKALALGGNRAKAVDGTRGFAAQPQSLRGDRHD